MDKSDKSDKRYLHQWEERPDPFADRRIEENGNYLCVQWSNHPLHVYRQMQPGEAVHQAVATLEHNGSRYCLMWIVDEQEHATAA